MNEEMTPKKLIEAINFTGTCTLTIDDGFVYVNGRYGCTEGRLMDLIKESGKLLSYRWADVISDLLTAAYHV